VPPAGAAGQRSGRETSGLSTQLVVVWLAYVARRSEKSQPRRDDGDAPSGQDSAVLFEIADAVRDGLIGINTIGGAVAGAVAGFAVSELSGQAVRRSSLVRRVLQSDSRLLIDDGKPVPSALFRASISLPELRQIARREGFEDLSEVQTAILKTNGMVTLLGRS
jgi:hypothetical protein